MDIGSLFSGLGGLELGLEMSGVGQTKWQVEKDEYCRHVLARHWPHSERFQDVKECGRSNLSEVELICGGFPCQDVSGAGKGAGLAGSRSGLWFEYLRIVDELRPKWVVVENVASGAKKWVDTVRNGLGQCGYESLPVPLSAANVGAPHERARIFIIATNTDRISVYLKSGRMDACDANGDCKSAIPLDAEAPWLCDVAGNPPHWSTAPEFRGVDDGVSGRLDSARRRNKALGNAVVPQCAEVIGWMIREISSK